MVATPLHSHHESNRQPEFSPNSLRLHGVSWETYERLIEDIGEGHTQVAYDHGTMEIRLHHGFAQQNCLAFLAGVVSVVSFLTKSAVASGGSTTCKRRDLETGFDPDTCYWIDHESVMRGVREFDPKCDPPPDLVIDVDLSGELLDRLEIYRVFGIAEVWRRKNDDFQILVLTANSKYQPVECSRSFPLLTVSGFRKALDELSTKGEDFALRNLLAEIGLTT